MPCSRFPGGWFGDRVGPRIAMASVVVWWSVFTFITGFSISVTMLMVCLFLIGVGEAGAFPISNRALSRWMLPGERGIRPGRHPCRLAPGRRLGPVPGRHPDRAYGWHMPFFLFGAGRHRLGAAWFWYYRDVPSEHASVNQGEREQDRRRAGQRPRRARRFPGS